MRADRVRDPRRPAWCVAVVALLGCGATGNVAVPAAVWSLSDQPQLVIGMDGTPQGRLTNVIAVLPMQGGELAVVDRGPEPIRVYGEGGEYRRTIGRRGEAPGEFGVVSWVARLGDTLLVYDIGHRRATWLRADGSVLDVRTPRAVGHEGTVTPTDRLVSGAWLVSAGVPAPRLALADGVFRDTLYFGTLPPAGEGALQVFHRSLTPPAVQIPGGTRFVTGYYFALPMALRLGARVAVVDPEAATLTLYAEDGSEVSTNALPMPRQRTSRTELERQRDLALEGVDERARAAVAARFTPGAMPEEVPAFRRAVADGDQVLWLEEWSHDDSAPARYQVVAVDGRWTATVAMPPGFTPLTIGPDWVLGVHQNPEGGQRVVRYGLTRAPAPVASPGGGSSLATRD